MAMIPALICPSISRFDLLEKMLGSIDYPVEEIVIVDNSCSGYVASGQFGHLNIKYIRPIEGLGYGGGINEGIRQTPGKKWWMFTNNDIVFRPGGLAMVAKGMESRTHASMITCGFYWGAINRECVERIGLFDDWTFFPIYYDDNDYYRRCSLGGVEYVQYPLVNEYPESASLTINSDERYKNANNKSFEINKRKYIEKWGGLPGEETYSTPWNKDVPLFYTEPDITGRADRKW